MFASTPTEGEVARLLSSPEVALHLGGLLGADAEGISVRALDGRSDVFAVVGPTGEFIVRFPGDERKLASLRREEKIQQGLRKVVAIGAPDTRVVAVSDALPVFAIHTMVPGRDWFAFERIELSTRARDRLVTDLVAFLRATHGVPLPLACEWLGIPYDGSATEAALTLAEGKPGWFGPAEVSEIRRKLEPHLDAGLAELFDQTVARFEALDLSPEYLVFGHGDLHGGNLAFVEDELGLRLVGVFDLENAGILDIHYDFCRLNLIDDDLQTRAIAEYQATSGRARLLDAERIEVYSRAFLLYLMAEQVEQDGRLTPGGRDSYLNLVELLRRHVAHYELGGSRGNSRPIA